MDVSFIGNPKHIIEEMRLVLCTRIECTVYRRRDKIDFLILVLWQKGYQKINIAKQKKYPDSHREIHKMNNPLNILCLTETNVLNGDTVYNTLSSAS